MLLCEGGGVRTRTSISAFGEQLADHLQHSPESLGPPEELAPSAPRPERIWDQDQWLHMLIIRVLAYLCQICGNLWKVDF